jgi:hypothetical protein
VPDVERGVGVEVFAREGGPGVCARVGESSMRWLMLLERVGPGVWDRAGTGVCERDDDIGPGVWDLEMPPEDANIDVERMCVALKRARDGAL